MRVVDLFLSGLEFYYVNMYRNYMYIITISYRSKYNYIVHLFIPFLLY